MRSIRLFSFGLRVRLGRLTMAGLFNMALDGECRRLRDGMVLVQQDLSTKNFFF